MGIYVKYAEMQQYFENEEIIYNNLKWSTSYMLWNSNGHRQNWETETVKHSEHA